MKSILTLIDLTKYHNTRKLCLRVSINFRMEDEYPCFPLAAERYPLPFCEEVVASLRTHVSAGVSSRVDIGLFDQHFE